MECQITHGDGEYYTLMVNGKFEGNFDRLIEAAKEYERIKEERENEQSA